MALSGRNRRTFLSPGPPVSEAIRSLEHEVGGRLFVRTSRRVQLTPLDEKLRLGVEPAALVLRATLEECSRDIAAGLVDAVGHGGR
jgi:DNA-binding transcriptional LysR family regulator